MYKSLQDQGLNLECREPWRGLNTVPSEGVFPLILYILAVPSNGTKPQTEANT